MRLTRPQARETILDVKLLALLLTLSTIVSACGSPDASAREFRFTPVAYNLEPGPESTPYAVATNPESGVRYLADQVVVHVPRDRVDRFTDWASKYPFETVVLIDDLGLCAADRSQCPENAPNGVSVLVIVVPVGGAPDALNFLLRQEDVILAELNEIGRSE